MNKHINKYLVFGLSLLFMTGCNKFLDSTPPSQISPEIYLDEESQLGAYTIGRYDMFPSHGNWSFGTFGIDGNTDNMVTPNLDNRFIPGEWRVSGTTDGDWNFGNIRQMNYFIQEVVPKWKANKILGNADNIQHYIGEAYFLRAFEYFQKLQSLGDFPITREVYDDSNFQLLVDASKRSPRNEVARFILSDLDSAITLLKSQSPGGKQRISKDVALLLKSRVGLFEGTWLKYFKGTAFVPGGKDWPGNTKEFTANYQYPSGSIDTEIDYFLDQSMVAAKDLASRISLVSNTGIIESPNNENPYFNMFSAVDMSGYSEVLLWRQYNQALVQHNVPVYAQGGNYAVGLTRSMVESFLMSNGLPIYASGSGYHGDDYIQDVRKDRDGRLTLFLKEPGQRNILVNTGEGNSGIPVEPYPRIWETSWEQRYTSGYAIRKGLSYDGLQTNNGQGYTGNVIFRATEAYLNYIEAVYERTGSLDGTARDYWRKIRERAKVNTDIDKTIAATDVSKEVLDWGAYSAGKLIDPTLYNIRRERRNELMAEGLRWMDLRRWRSMDQLINNPAHFEGFKLWGPMKEWYSPEQLVYGADNDKSIVSDPALSEYLRPLEIRRNTFSYEGVRFNRAHYLSPIALGHFIITSPTNDVSQSVIYQNPGWPTAAGAGPLDN